MSAAIVTLYCRGTSCRLEPWEGAEPIRVDLTTGVWVDTDPAGEALFYTGERSLGLGLNTALMLGLCRAAEKGGHGSAAAARHRELRALERERLLASVERLVTAVRAAADVRSPLGTWANRPTPPETLDRLAEYFEQIVEDRKSR